MKAILFVAHGSRKAKGNQEIKHFVQAFKETLNTKIVELSYLEFAQPSIQEGVATCVEKGCSKIILMPLLLTDAVHAKEDIPKEIEKMKTMYPQIGFCYGNPIGIHKKMYEILSTRLKQTQITTDKNTAVILVAKGSSLNTANDEFLMISKEFSKYSGVEMVRPAFMSFAFPKLQEAIEQCLEEGATKFVILPYIMFHGVLVTKIQTQINNFKIKYPNYTFVIGDYLGFHPFMYEIIKERVDEISE